MSYDVDKMRKAVPYCESLDIAIYGDPGTPDYEVIITCNFVGEMYATVHSTTSPTTTDELIELIAAAGAQCLPRNAITAEFGRMRSDSTPILKRSIGRENANGRPWQSREPLLPWIAQAMSSREAAQLIPGVIDVNGYDTSTSVHQKCHAPVKGVKSRRSASKALPPTKLRIDRGKMDRANQAISTLVAKVEHDDDDDA